MRTYIRERSDIVEDPCTVVLVKALCRIRYIGENRNKNGKADILYVYNELGERIRTVQDIDNFGVIDLAGPDKVSDSHTLFEKDDSGDWWQKSFQVLYPNGNSTPVTNGISRSRLTGLGESRTIALSTGDTHTALLASEQVSTDIHGNDSVSQQLLNRDQKQTIALSSTPASALTNAAITVAGLQVKSISSTGIVTTNWFDNLGRRIMSGNLSADVLQSNPVTIEQLESAVATSGNRNTFTLMGYNDKGQVEWTRDSASNTTWFAYNTYGQRYAVIRTANISASLTSAQLENETFVFGLLDDEDFSVSYTAYSPEGQTIATYGNAYPVVYEYDEQNRMVAMATTRDEDYRTINLLTLLPAGETLSTWQPAANVKIDITKWVYDSATGLLTDKVYSDGKGPEYSYTSDGKLSQRTWARGVITDYKYDIAGAITNIVYNDETPHVAYTYNRLGQQLSAITYDSPGALISSNYFVYASTLELDYELQNGTKIDRTSDTLGRNKGYELFNPVDLVNPVQKIEYGYNNLGQFNSVTSVNSVVEHEFDYSYLPGTGLISGYTASTPSTGSTFLTVSKTYELNRNLITAITNSVGVTPVVITAFDYVNDALGRRTARSDYYINNNNPSATANSFGYNTFSEVTNN